MALRPRHLQFAALALGACASGPPAEIPPPSTAAATPLDPADFPGADRVLAGFSARAASAGSWDREDAVLFGLELVNGDAVHRWLLHIEAQLGDTVQLTGRDGKTVERTIPHPTGSWTYRSRIGGEEREFPVKSAMNLVGVRVCDADGQELGKSSAMVPMQLMTQGLLPAVACALAHPIANLGPQGFDSADDVLPMARGILALVALLEIVQQDSVLEPYFWQVVQKPSLWSVVTGLGVEAAMTVALDKSVPIPGLSAPTAGDVQPYLVPVRVDVNGEPALLADLICVDAAPPYGLCAGIAGITARHPTRTDLHFRAELLAARRGADATR